MAMRDEDFGATPTLTEAEDGFWSPPLAAPASEPRDWQSLCEQAQARAEMERARADTAEARCEELRRAEREACSRAGSLKWNLDKSRDKLKAAIEEVKEIRRAAKDALFFQSEVGRLEKLLSEAGVESSKRSTIMSLRMEVFQLRDALQSLQAGKDAVAAASGGQIKLPKAVPAPKPGKNTAGTLRGEVASLSRQVCDRYVRTMSSVIEMNSGEMTYSGSLPSSLGGQTVTAAIAATGRPERKQLKRQKFPASPPVRASNARRWSSVMLVVMGAVSRAVAQEDRSPALGFGRSTPDPTS